MKGEGKSERRKELSGMGWGGWKIKDEVEGERSKDRRDESKTSVSQARGCIRNNGNTGASKQKDWNIEVKSLLWRQSCVYAYVYI